MMKPAAFDTETGLIRPAQAAPPLVCLTSSIPVTGGRLFHVRDDFESPIHGNELCSQLDYSWARGAAKQHFEWLLTRDPLLGLNIAYDMAVCMNTWRDLAKQIFAAYDDDRVIDVGICQQLVDNARGLMTMWVKRQGYSLAALGKRRLGKDRSAEKVDEDAWRLRYAELLDVPLQQWPEAAVKYAIEDSDDTLEVGLDIIRKHEGLLADAPAQTRAAFALHLMACWGVMVDPERVERLREASEGMYEELSEMLVREGLVREDGTRDTKAAQQRMYDVMNGRIQLTDTGYEKLKKIQKEKGAITAQEAFSKEELLKYTALDEKACTESGDEILQAYSRRTQLHNIVNTHIPDLLQGVHTPIQPRYNVLVESGRTSCSKGKKKGQKKKPPLNGFQFQNPKGALDYFPLGVGIRECFIARPGRLFADNDYSGLELHTGAQACKATVGFSRMGDALNRGEDVHLLFAAQMMGITYEEAHVRRHDKEVKYHRKLAKVANFGFPGGLGIAGLIGFAHGYGVKLTEAQCKKLRSDWFKAFPEWVEYFKWVRGHIDRIEAATGKRADEKKGSRSVIEQLYVGRIRGGITFTSGCNTMFQGLGADGAKRGMWEVTKRCYADPESILYGVRPVGFIHDEILAEVFEELAHEQAYEMAQVMVEGCNQLLPDYPVRCEPALCKRWMKGPEAVFNFDGRLQPYDLAHEGRWEVYYDREHREPVDWSKV
jgi:DNA polymerase-1